MRTRNLLLLAALATLAAPPAASAAFQHVVAPGESLYSVAAADGLSVAQLAAANGLAPNSQLIAGSTVSIPPQGTTLAPVATSSGSVAGSSAYVGDGDADADDGVSVATNVASSVAAAPSGGSYVVAPGDTLSAIAARAGTSVAGLAAANGIDPNAPLLSGSVLKLSGAGSAPASSVASSLPQTAMSQPVGAPAQGSPSGGPYPTPERMSASQIGAIAAANGVPPSLVQAIGWQESGFNNNLVSSADARGVMQILPGTWNWIGQTLAGSTPLAPASAASNVRGGVLLLHSLLSATGGNPALAAAGYYQGLSSVRQNGMYPDTQQYVNNVLALQHRFGGP